MVFKMGMYSKAAQQRRWMATGAIDKAKVVIIGGGTAGITVAAHLRGHVKDITIIEPSATHRYQPMWLFEVAGIKEHGTSCRPMSQVMPQHVKWIQESVVSIEPDKSVVRQASGESLPYDALIVAPGLTMNWDRVQGLGSPQEFQNSDSIFSIYSGAFNVGMPRALKEFKGGRALFTQPSTPVKCAGAPQKILYLVEEMLQEKGLRETSSLDFYTGMGKIFAIDKYAQSLTQVCQSRDIAVHLCHDLVAVDQSKKEATFKFLSDTEGKKVTVPFDLLHVTPPMGPPSFIKNIGNADGWVNVDKYTTQHVQYDNIFSLGDASSLPTSKTAAAVAAQASTTSGNLVSYLSGKSLDLKYDGYTSCPLITKKGKVILAEFSGYTQETMETFPYNQAKEHSLPYFLVKDFLPWIYWRGMLRGLWNGPGFFRRILNPSGK